MLHIPAEDAACDVFVRTVGNRAVLLVASLIAAKATRDTQGVQVLTLKAKHAVCEACLLDAAQAAQLKKYRVKTIPATGGLAKDLPSSGQMTLLSE